ncbi:MAG: hypothetical protein V4563_14055 [Pseudomonadota bacterium]
MSIDSKHSYRFEFLKSEEWKGRRLIILAERLARCEICSVEDWSNDVHHTRYRKNWDHYCRSDLRVACRDCHDIIHFVMAHRKAMGAKDNHQRYWRNIRRSARRIQRHVKRFGKTIAIARFSALYKKLQNDLPAPPATREITSDGDSQIFTTGSAGIKMKPKTITRTTCEPGAVELKAPLAS